MTDEPGAGGARAHQQPSTTTAADAAATAAADAGYGPNGTAGAADGAGTSSRPGALA